MDDTRAVFYVTDKDKYVREAIQSSASVKRCMPDITRVIATAPDMIKKMRLDDSFEIILPLGKKLHDLWFLNSTLYILEMLERLYSLGIQQALYLDTDTYVCTPVYELFELMNWRYEFAGAHAPGRKTCPTVDDIPACFPEINIGVNAMQVFSCISLMNEVYSQYEKHQDVYGNNDQGALREVLWNKTGRYRWYVLPPEYNLRLFPSFISGEVKILHGRCIDMTYEQIDRAVNSSDEMRIWHKRQILPE